MKMIEVNQLRVYNPDNKKYFSGGILDERNFYTDKESYSASYQAGTFCHHPSAENHKDCLCGIRFGYKAYFQGYKVLYESAGSDPRARRGSRICFQQRGKTQKSPRDDRTIKVFPPVSPAYMFMNESRPFLFTGMAVYI
jgi:hypothetical protein